MRASSSRSMGWSPPKLPGGTRQRGERAAGVQRASRGAFRGAGCGYPGQGRRRRPSRRWRRSSR
eukprot:8190513-Pyramimonas_sp.AAC.1